ncbi:hypothetical protein AB0C65_35795 [Nocardia sp. NPDC048505]|uniref:hypothetical protein n=1 Tax=Nocardia sp. NPDC048505 TaxID=3155756 RepID=UPI0033F4FAE8
MSVAIHQFHSALRWGVAAAAAVLAAAVVSTPPAHAHAQPPAFACAPSAAAEGEVIGSGPGGFDTGPAAILGFEHAYYVSRSAVEALRFVDPASVLADRGPGLQAGIDAVALGTRHCVRIRPIDTDGPRARWAVSITEFDAATSFSHSTDQIITTRTAGGRTLLGAITPA